MNPLLPISKEQLDLAVHRQQLTPLSNITDLLITLQLWVTMGWLRPLDQAFSAFLAEQSPNEHPSVLLAAALTSYQLNHGHVCLDISLSLHQPEFVLNFSQQYAQESWHPSQVLARLNTHSWLQQMQASNLISKTDNPTNTPLILKETRLYLYRYWYYENTLTQQIKQRLNTELTTPTELSQQLNNLFKDNQQSPDWQKIACAIATRKAFTIITGGPGTGKTTTVIRLLALLQAPAVQANKPLNIRLAAPTGKAAARLTESIGQQVASLDIEEHIRSYIPTQVSTLHRLLISRPNSRHFVHNKTNPLALDMLIIDEASMIDLELFAQLLEALPHHCRLILLGDKNQLASVEAGAVLGDLCLHAEQGFYSTDTLAWLTMMTGEDLSQHPLMIGTNQTHPLAQQTVMLRHSRRFSDLSGIGQLAKWVNQGNVKQARQLITQQSSDLSHLKIDNPQAESLIQFILEGSQFEQGYCHYLNILRQQRPNNNIPPYDPVWSTWANNVLEAFGQFQLLAVLKAGPWGVANLNQLIAYNLYKKGYLSHFEGWYEGRPILMTENDYGLGLMNGDIGIALAFPSENAPERTVLKVVFPYNDGSNKLHQVLPSRLTATETVFAMTVHKSQGSEFAHTALILPETLNPVLSKELLYTAITRAKKQFTLIESNPNIFNEAIKKQTIRLSGLKF